MAAVVRGNPLHGTRHLETSPQRSAASILAQPPSPPSTVWSLFVAPVVFFLSSSSRTTKPSTRRTRERFVERRDRYTTVTGHVLSDRPNPRHAEHASVSSDDATMTHVRRAPRPIPAHPSRTSSTQNASFSSDDATATARAPATRASWPTSWPTCKSRWRVTYGVGAFATARNGQMCPWGRRAGRPRPTRPRRAPSPLGGGGRGRDARDAITRRYVVLFHCDRGRDEHRRLAWRGEGARRNGIPRSADSSVPFIPWWGRARASIGSPGVTTGRSREGGRVHQTPERDDDDDSQGWLRLPDAHTTPRGRFGGLWRTER